MLEAARRGELLAEHASVRRDRAEDARESRARLEQEYLAALPVVPISRCPFSGEVVSMAIDTAGLDGLFWDETGPIRPLDEEMPETFFALTGAVSLGAGVENAPFPCTPGPQLPFVVPRMLLHPDVKAVVSQLPIGGHTGFPIVYYADPIPVLRRFNDWGTAEYSYETEDDPELFDSVDEEDEVLDFDLALWIERGDLLWIAPGDADLKLMTTVEGCPYLGLDGRRDFYWIQAGKLSDPPGTPPAKRSRRHK
ncbi:MAG: hypothetical protein QOE92_53 [Chloroflexota bacterium]|nr:hypothetical protein [Chloroflexota bacterium]